MASDTVLSDGFVAEAAVSMMTREQGCSSQKRNIAAATRAKWHTRYAGMSQ